MKITEFSLRNPLAVGVLTTAVILFGLAAYLSMGIGVFPNVSFPEVLVVTTDAGADPATIESQITKPIEDAVAALPNIDTITSTSDEGVSNVAVQFTTAANENLVPVDVQRVVNAIRGTLPVEADAPAILKEEISLIPVLSVGVSGPQPLGEITRIVNDRIVKALDAVPGVQSAQVSGGRDPEIQVKIDPAKLESHAVGLNQVQLALQSEQLQVPAGQLTSQAKDLNVRVNGLVTQPDQLGLITVATTPNGPVYLKDLGSVVDGSKKVDTINRVDGVPAVTINLTKLTAANAIAVSADVRKALETLQPTLPTGMRMAVVTDSSSYALQSFNMIQRTLIEAVLFTGLILLAFLHTWRSTLIVLVAIPTSLFTTFGLMSVLGMDLNLFSMLAVTLSVGILVDDSIVVLENIFRHLKLGDPPVLAAINGRSEIGLAALTITLVDVAVYLPIALISGVAGDFIRPFALVVAAATLTSLLVSFTLTPLLASRLVNRGSTAQIGNSPLAVFGRWWDGGFERLAHGYQRLLRRVLIGHIVSVGRVRIGSRWSVIALGVLASAAGGVLFASGLIGVDIFPSGDQSQINMTLTMPPATTIEATNAAVQKMEQQLKGVPEVRSVYSSTGSGSNGLGLAGGDTAGLTVLLVPISDRTRSANEIADDFRHTQDPHIPQARLDVAAANAFGFGSGAGQPILVAVRGPDPTTLNHLVDQVTAEIRTVPGAMDVNNSNQKTQQELVLQIDRARAADQAITTQVAAGALRTAIDGTVATKFRQIGLDDVDIRVMLDDSFRASPDQLGSLPLISSAGRIVHLGSIGTIVAGSAPTRISHVDRERSVNISASVSGAPVGTVQAEIQNRLSHMPLPSGYSISYLGAAAQGAAAFVDVFKALGISLVLMYVLMIMLFGSLTVPLAVLMSLPLAVIGALGALAVTGNAFSLFSLLGIAMLVGLVGKNAILLVDFTDTLRKRGVGRTEALLEAGPARLRPIVMTTMSIFASLAPVALGSEAGSELLKAAALVLIGGLLTSTLLTLVFIPAMYTIFDDIEEFVRQQARRVSTARVLEPSELAILGRAPVVVPVLELPASPAEGQKAA